jgi:hypothetical protein
MAIETKSATTLVKYTKDGNELEQEVPYTAKQAPSLEDAMQIADETVAAVGEKEGEIPVTAENRQDLMVAWILSRFNQVMEANARQAARAQFLTSVAGPDKAITSMAKKLAALKNISLVEAEKAIRTQFGF